MLMSLPPVSPARTSALRESAPDWPGAALDFGGKLFEPFAWYDPATSSWKTWTRFLTGEWEPFSGTWPRQGMTRSGIAFRPLTSEPRTTAPDGSLLRTPLASDGDSFYAIGCGAVSRRIQHGRQIHWIHHVALLLGLDGPLKACPRFAEMLMGYPPGRLSDS